MFKNKIRIEIEYIANYNLNNFHINILYPKSEYLDIQIHFHDAKHEQ